VTGAASSGSQRSPASTQNSQRHGCAGNGGSWPAFGGSISREPGTAGQSAPAVPRDQSAGITDSRRPWRSAWQLARASVHAEQHVMVEAVTDDQQQLTGLNEIYIGQASHQTARYTLTLPEGRAERQASSGLIVPTGTGATGWCPLRLAGAGSTLVLPDPPSVGSPGSSAKPGPQRRPAPPSLKVTWPPGNH
jgi:hypothetical protein